MPTNNRIKRSVTTTYFRKRTERVFLLFFCSPHAGWSAVFVLFFYLGNQLNKSFKIRC